MEYKDIQEKIADLLETIFAIEMCSHLDYEDYDRIKEAKKELEILIPQMVGAKGWVVVCKYCLSVSKNSYIDNKGLHGSMPYLFFTEDEAEKMLKHKQDEATDNTFAYSVEKIEITKEMLGL